MVKTAKQSKPESASKRMSLGQQTRAVFGVAKLSFSIAPGAIIFKATGSVLDAILPLVTTYYAAQTTTVLAAAYGGDSSAGRRAMTYVAITVALGLTMTVWSSINNYIQAKMRYLVEARVSDRMYAHFLSLDFWRYDDKDTADLYDKATRFSSFYAYAFDRITSLFSQLIGMVSAVIALALFQPLLALCVLAAIIPGIYVQFRLSRKQLAHWNENVEVRRAKSMLEWTLGQPQLISELRLYNMVTFMLKRRRELRDTDERDRIEFEKVYLPLRLFSNGLQALAELGALIWITAQIIARNHPIGQFLYVQQVTARAIRSGTSFVSTLAQIDEDIANLFDYQQFMQLPAGSTSSKKLRGRVEHISLKDVCFTYPGSTTVTLQNITMDIAAGQHVAIVGENGAGKSTLIKLLTGLYKPASGQISLDDNDLHDYDIASWHRQLGVLQQEFIHYNFATVGDNIRFGDVQAPRNKQRMANAMEEAEASSFINKLPRGKHTYANNWMEDAKGGKGQGLSGGQWQRLALARDFYRNAPIIILDEPTSAIDALAEARIFKRLFADHQRTVITISHRLSTIEKADIVYMLEDGKIVESGTHTELAALRGRYYRMFESQLSV